MWINDLNNGLVWLPNKENINTDLTPINSSFNIPKQYMYGEIEKFLA